MGLRNSISTVIKIILPSFVLITITGFISAILEVASAYCFYIFIKKIFNMGDVNLPEILNTNYLNIFFAYIILYIIGYIVNYSNVLYSTNIGVKITEFYVRLISKTNINIFNDKDLSYYQVIIFEEIRKIQERFFQALGIVISRIFIIILYLALITTNFNLSKDSLYLIILTALIIISALFFIYKNSRYLGNKIIEKNENKYHLISDYLSRWRYFIINDFIDEVNRKISNYGYSISKILAKISTAQSYSRQLVEVALMFSLVCITQVNNQQIEVNTDVIILFSIYIVRLMPAISAVISNGTVIASSYGSFRYFINEVERVSIQENNINSENNKVYYKNQTHLISCCNIFLEVRNKKILSNFSFNFPSFGVIFIIGESGVGKTSLINMLLGFIRPKSGEIYFNGENIFNNIENIRSNIALFEQNNNFIQGTVGDYLKVNKLNNDECIELFVKLKLSDKNSGNNFFNRKIMTLSGGEIQRVVLISSLISSKNIIILDEFGSALDSYLLLISESVIREYSLNKLVIWITHNKSLLRQSDQIIELTR